MTAHIDGHDPGRPPILDDSKRQRIIALLANGSSRRVAAAYVGCAASTITRTAVRDPEFAAELARAEQNCEVRALRTLNNAAQNDRYWRASAWLLERRNPEDFAPRQPNLFTQEQLRQLFLHLFLRVTDDLPEEKFTEIERRLDELVDRLNRECSLGPPPARKTIAAESDPRNAVPEDWPDDDRSPPETPPAGRDFATDPTQAVEYFGEGPSPYP